ncbi:hypothetical protein QO010_000048 [Caulobacter ginsengisoli]|uniref:Uncharacterized protein n=1 Tax=Caulobacter ginsengisoli TaxID=400775 RepID=A0ABU0ILM0_9CAUL|nr:hypothetical protein [Caulobacter ginsengisoli]MDQ0462300.1 hypothetical protein [Caulobacter ginsengisoli]
MRHLRLILALSVAVSAVSPAPLMARQSAAASADAATCMGAYGALGKLRDNLAVTNPDLKDIPNYASIDFSARKTELQRRTAFDPATVNANESAAITLLTGGVIDNDPSRIQRVIDTVSRCDSVFGFRPQLGQVQGAVAPSAPAPTAPLITATPIAPAAPPPAAPKPKPGQPAPPVVSAMDDRSCSVAYLALSWGNSANPTLAQALLDRAKAAGAKYMAAKPSLAVGDVQTDIQTAAKARLDPIVDGTSGPETLFADVRSCDAKYGYGIPEGATP